MFSFSVRLLQGDSLVWRQQCMLLQNMMRCVATNTTSCPSDDPDLETLQTSLTQLVEQAGDHCPWLSPNLCTEEKACGVVDAGCEVALQTGLINRRKDVCTLKDEADTCVRDNTQTCTRAQINQAQSVMDKKLQAAGLPKQLSCGDGDIEGYLYSFLITSADITINGRETEACSNYQEQYNSFNTHFTNPDSKAEIAFAKGLVDAMFGQRLSACGSTGSNLECARTFPVKDLAHLITDLLLKDEVSDTSFCSQVNWLINQGSNGCSPDFFTINLSNADIYRERCVGDIPDCDAAEGQIAQCIADVGVWADLDCSGKQQAADCVTALLPSSCSYKAAWLPEADLCPETVVLRANHNAKQFISEAGLKAEFTWQLVAGNTNFRIVMSTKPVDEEALPRCLKGSRVNEPIDQVYTDNPSKTFDANTASFLTFEVLAREDYRQDGPQGVDVEFMLYPSVIGEKGDFEDIPNAQFPLPQARVEVDDRSLPNSACSSINDPHLQTFDGFDYNNQEEGKYLLYRHATLPEAVIVEYSMCSKYGSCNCGCRIFAGKSILDFDLCDPDTDLLTFSTDSQTTNINQQRMRVLKEQDLRTYHVILIESGTIVKVKIEGEYLNVWVMPSAKDLGKTQGLCGVYDGDGYNDLQLPDLTNYIIQDADIDYGVLEPITFNEMWKIEENDAFEFSKVYAEGVELVEAPVPEYCHGSKGETCNSWAHIAACGFVQGEDETSRLLENFLQENNAQRKRKKRQAEAPQIRTNSTIASKNASWPTPSGWTKETAEAYCLDNLYDAALIKCMKVVNSQDSRVKVFDLNRAKDTCIDDVRLSDGVDWIRGASSLALQKCMSELNENPVYQSDPTSSDLAIEFMDATCQSHDCSGHGTCSMGSCLCDPDYYGVECSVHRSELTPPVLKAPLDGSHMCEVDSNSECSAVFLSGSNFVLSPDLSCHIREVEVTTFGVEEIPGSKVRRVRAELIATDRVRCDLGGRSEMKRTFMVSVSNDGVTPHADYQLFVAYDPVCFRCDYDSCTRQNDVCVIGKACVRPGAFSVYDDCNYCDLSNPTEWTVRTELERCQDKGGDHDTLALALIGAGCGLVLILIVLVLTLVCLRRRKARKHRGSISEDGAHSNPTYYGDNLPFDGKPVLQIQTRDNAEINNINGKDLVAYA